MPEPDTPHDGPVCIDVHDRNDVARWAFVLLVSADDIVGAVRSVGPAVVEVIRFLAERTM